ncbi:response regulator [Aquabacterium sp. A7-Y]|uniref:response regulator n=1 Tax=Aquabacterium sp. A7-Y TaxID=1349605 RepID=UPI00223CD53E|nr:response regulator [Aquabacterium sp. A7-Y]MCW7538452.1 response regulator [Aquabacterium sp. A7-Y]
MSARILVVDDNPLNLELATELLQMEGYEVTTATDSEQAQQSLATQLPDLVLLDLSLPRMDGLTLTRKLKADPRYADVPVVALTALAMKGDEEKALEAGCNGYITKPIDTLRFAAQVRQTLRLRQSAAATGPGLKVLVVEDRAVDMRLASAVLAAGGHRVAEAGTAEAALEAVMSDRPDVILLDLELPGQDGMSLLRRLKAMDELRLIPVVAVTALPERYREGEVLAAGCDAFITRPFNTRELGQLLARVAGPHEGARGE